jgi:murein DD-endopeptidase MepM/ murein hydrolase activator NlpD
MLSGKGTVLISQKQNENLTYQIYDHKPEYIQTLNQAALDLGYDSLISYLKKNSSSIEFNGQVLYTCTEELMDLKANSKLMISEDYQLFFFTELDDQKNPQAEKGLDLSPLPKTKKAYEILLEFQQGKNLIIPSHTDATNDDYCLGLSYYSPEGEASGELWHDFTKNASNTFQGLTEEYFFTNNTESNIYNHSGRKYGFYISQDDLSIRYLEREGELDEFQLSAWREEIKEKSLLYFLGLQHVESVHGSYSRRSVFIFNSENKLIMHYRTTDIGASHISDYIKIRLNDYLERIGENFSNIKILLADGDHNAQTYLPDEAFSDERLNSYGFHFILRPFTHRASLSVAKTENTTETKSQGGFKSSKLVKDLKKKLTLLKPSSILSGFWRYKNNPQELFTRIKNNISILSLNDEIKSGRREFELRLNDENLGIEDCKRSDDFDLSTSKQSKNLQAENFPHKSLINLNTEPLPEKRFTQPNSVSNLPTAIYIKDFKINLKEIYKGYSTYVLDEQGSEKRLYLKTTKNIKILNAEPEAVSNIKEVMKNFIFHYGLSGKEVNIEEKNGQKQEKNNSHLRFDTQIIYPAAFCQSTLNEYQRKETEFSLAKLLFGFDTNHKLTSPYGLRSRHPITGETKFHHGIDYNALRGQTIYAPVDLKIYKSNFDKELGHYLIAEALNLKNEIGEKLYILCAHLNEAQEQETGTIVLKHSPLCKSGSTGLSTAPHLHFETRFAKMWDLYFEARSIDPIIVFYYLLNQE